MQTFLQDIRFAFRRFRKDPAFIAVTIVTLALGIGATSAIFSVVNGVLLRPLPFPHSDPAVLLMEQTKQFPRLSVSYQNFADWRGQAQSYESIAAVRNAVVTLSGSGEPERFPRMHTNKRESNLTHSGTTSASASAGPTARQAANSEREWTRRKCER
jgi:hypothetical protein